MNEEEIGNDSKSKSVMPPEPRPNQGLIAEGVASLGEGRAINTEPLPEKPPGSGLWTLVVSKLKEPRQR